MSVGRFLQQAAAGAGGGTGDDDFANVVLLLDGDGTNGDANNTFTDSSTNGFTVTENGSVVQGSFSPYGDNWSFYFDSGEYIYTPSTDQFVCGTSTDFTIELWYCSAPGYSPIQYDVLISQWPSGSPTTGKWFVGLKDSGGAATFYNRDFSFSTGLLNGTTDITDGKWHHIAVTRTGSVFRLFVDGTQEDTATRPSDDVGMTASIYFNTYAAAITAGNDNYGEGWISNARLIQGTSLYTTDFTAPTSPLTAVTNTKFLSAQSNRFIENSSNNFSFTINGTPKVTPFSPFKDDNARTLTTDGGSAYFDGGEYLTASDNAVFNFGTGDFTVEAWVYLTGGAGGIWTNGPTSSGSFGFYFQGTNELRCDYYGGTGLISAIQAPDYEWHHVAVIRSGSTLSLYRNGVREATTTTSSNNTTDSFTVGRAWTNDAGGNLQGYISDLRVVKGTALYTGTSYTVPTTPLTAVTNTSGLLNFQDAGIYDRSGINNLDTVGNAQIDTAVVKYGTGSMQFDGSGDYLQTIPTEELYFTDKDFTVEGWVYLNNLSSAQNFFYYGATNRSTSNASGIAFSVLYQPSAGYFRASQYYASTGGFGANNTLVTPSANQWYHVAYYRIGSQFYLAVDGNVANIGSFSQPLLNGASWVFRAGLESDSVGDPFNGYLDDIRITMGKARYGTSNFTPPDAALPKF